MNHLVIKNDGLICAEDLILIGSSSKRDQVGKIGMFGSGWKYALSWLLRNGCNPKIFAGQEEIVVDFTPKMHRSNSVNVITVNGIESSLTTEMGPKWTGWMALREVISNAIDEGGNTLETLWNPSFQGEDNKTTIYIPMNSELAEVLMKYDKYFAFNRKENYSVPTARVFVKKEPSDRNVYRKGIRCFDTSEQSILDFDFNDIDINEDRLCSDWNVKTTIRQIIEENEDCNLLELILRDCNTDCHPYSMSSSVLAQVKQLVDKGCEFTTSTLVKLGGMIFGGDNAIFIRGEWYKKLQDLGLVKNPFDFFDDDFTFIRTNEKNMTGVQYYLDNFGVKPEILSGKMEHDVKFKSGTAYIKDTTKYSDKEVAAYILSGMKSADFLPYLK